jgi:acyl-CoA synthetase (AMP-forming)/AMP-acid ligase II
VDLARNLIQRINVGDSLTRSAAARPAHLAVVDGDRQWTYRDFNGWVNQLAHGLAARGFTRGDALGVASGNSAEFLAVYFACAKLGLVCVPINLGWRSGEVGYVLDHSGALGLVAETQLVDHPSFPDRELESLRRCVRPPARSRRTWSGTPIRGTTRAEFRTTSSAGTAAAAGPARSCQSARCPPPSAGPGPGQSG